MYLVFICCVKYQIPVVQSNKGPGGCLLLRFTRQKVTECNSKTSVSLITNYVSNGSPMEADLVPLFTTRRLYQYEVAKMLSQFTRLCVNLFHTEADLVPPLLPADLTSTGWRRCIGCLILIGHFPPEPYIGSFAERDLQFEASYASSLPCSCHLIYWVRLQCLSWV